MEGGCFIAFDLGATSGRAMLASLSAGRLEFEEIHRFPNRIVDRSGHLFWDFDALFGEILEGLRKAAGCGVEIKSVGIDSWGVDVAFFGSDGKLVGQPYCYRDPQTAGAPERFFSEHLDRDALYARTGIQVMEFNTLFQLESLKRRGAPELEAARHILFLPDAINYMLSGRMTTEYTIASTSHFMDPVRKELDSGLLESIGLSAGLFAPMVQPGTVTALLSHETAALTGLPRIPLVSVAGHDTASAVVAVPATTPNFAYLSSGTWSLMGVECNMPVLSSEAASANITNEGGVFGTTRFLKNITGMWIVENLLREWKETGSVYTYDDLQALSDRTEPFACFIDPDDPSFSNPPSMLGAIDAFCDRTGQERPSGHAAYIRTVFESLAMRYNEVLQQIVRISGQKVDVLHIIGGGSRNRLLNRFTANTTGRTVMAGPSEATAAGNVMMQAFAAGMVHDLHGIRSIMASGESTECYVPADTARWHKGYMKYLKTVR